jgi:hypothetical protein
MYIQGQLKQKFRFHGFYLRLLPPRIGQLVDHLWLHLSNADFYPCHLLSRLPANCEKQLCLLQLNVDSSSLDEALHTPNTLKARKHCPQTFSFQGSKVYHYLVYSGDWSENPSLENFLLHFDKELATILSSASVFHLVSYPSKSWETLLTIYTSHSTFVPSWMTHSRIWGCPTQFYPYRTVVNNLRITVFLPYPP